MILPNGTLVSFVVHFERVFGFVVGTCSYDAAGPDNAYVVRYCWPDDGRDPPRKPYTVVAMSEVERATEFPENFVVGCGWPGTPDDRCGTWKLVRTADGLAVAQETPRVTV